jgi:hypothetical protein
LPSVLPNPKHDGFGLAWFADTGHLASYEEWYCDSQAQKDLQDVLDLDNSPVVAAEEHVMRGADWLDERWRQGGSKFKHMAIAQRAKGLTLKEFFELWQTRAGKVGGAVIPDEARGLAYAQNRPLLTGEEWAYDALNEVYFNDLEGLRARIDYFAATMSEQSEDDLVSEAYFVAVTEDLIFDQA